MLSLFAHRAKFNDVVFHESTYFVEDELLLETSREGNLSLICSIARNELVYVRPGVTKVNSGCILHSFDRVGHIESLSFGSDSKLERIEDEAFKYCHIEELHVPR